VRIAQTIAYPHAVWSALRPLVEVARRDGRAEEAAEHETHRRALLELAATTLSADDLRRDLAAAADA
jgi:hypothetical protein